MKQRYEDSVSHTEESNKSFLESLTFEQIAGPHNILESMFELLPPINAGELTDAVFSAYTDKNGNKAIIPWGWAVSGVASENTIWGKDLGLVIYRIPEDKIHDIDWTDSAVVRTLQEKYDQLVWLPAGILKANGTLDGTSFTENFGRRNYANVSFNEDGFHEPLTGDLLSQKESIDFWDGFFFTRYPISRDEKTGRPRSVRDADPWVGLNYEGMKKISASMYNDRGISSHLTYGAEYDTREEWVIETGTKTRSDIVEPSADYCYRSSVLKTGSTQVNNIGDFSGNIAELTQEENYKWYRTLRGGSPDKSTHDRAIYDPLTKFTNVGFRASMLIQYFKWANHFKWAN